MKKIIIYSGKKTQKSKKSEKYNPNHIDKKKQVEYINKLFLNDDFSEKNDVISELKKKLNSYKQQDIKKKRYDKDKFITFDELVEKLVVSKLRCSYCRKECLVFYENIREKNMWTLDRVNNDIGHYGDNVVVSCLQCNLQKRRRSDNSFRFAKQMVIIKK